MIERQGRVQSELILFGGNPFFALPDAVGGQGPPPARGEDGVSGVCLGQLRAGGQGLLPGLLDDVGAHSSYGRSLLAIASDKRVHSGGSSTVNCTRYTVAGVQLRSAKLSRSPKRW
jgi:hypothetical protein